MDARQNGNQTPQPTTPAIRLHEADTGLPLDASGSQESDLADAARQRRADHRMRNLLIRAEYRMKDLVRHPDGGHCTVAEAQQEAAAERGRIEEDVRRGSRKHHRLPRWQRHIPQLVLLLDFSLLLYFFSDVTDVDWESPLSANLGFAIILAAMVTVLSYGFLSFTGHRLRMHKDHSGSVPMHELDTWTRAALGGAAVIIAVLAVLMFTRMRLEVLYALGPAGGNTALVIALTLAVVSVAANSLVVMIHAYDGSHQVDRMDKLSAAARRGVAKAHRMRERAAHQADR
jgi:hypothetical protein